MTDADRTSKDAPGMPGEATGGGGSAGPTAPVPAFEVRFDVDEDVSRVHHLAGGERAPPVPVVPLEPSLEWLTRHEMAREARIGRGNAAAFEAMWSRLAELANAGRPLELDGRSWNGALVRCIRRRVEFCMHVDERESLSRAFGRTYLDHRKSLAERVRNWTDSASVAAGRNRDDADAIDAVWAEALAREAEAGAKAFEHLGIRFRRFRTGQGSDLFLHVDDEHALILLARARSRLRGRARTGRAGDAEDQAPPAAPSP